MVYRSFLLKRLKWIAGCLFIGYLFQVEDVTCQERRIVIPDGPQVIKDQHHIMASAAEILEKMYLRPITYEDPIWQWKGDMDNVPNAIGELIPIPKRGSFVLPSEANPRKTEKLDAKLLKMVVDSYVDQTDGPRFKVESSQFGLHLIPDMVRDVNGQFVKAKTCLDVIVTIPEDKRTPSGHFMAICSAVNIANKTGPKLICVPQHFDGYFSKIPLSVIPTAEEITQISFPWGIKETGARSALIDLLMRSVTTIKWHISCDTRSICWLTNLGLKVNYMGSDGKPYETFLSQDKIKK